MRTGHTGGAPVLCVIDADASVREALCRVAASMGLGAQSFASIEQFLTDIVADGKGCVLLDGSLLRGGTQLKAGLRSRGLDWPMIVLCAGVDETARHEARALGAHFLLNKPVDAQALFDAIAWVTDEES